MTEEFADADACWKERGSRGGTALPAARELLSALFGQRDEDHPIVRWACELANLHYARAGEAIGATALTGNLVHEIDVWVELNVPQHHRGLVLHTETLGTVIDHIAAAQAKVAEALSDQRGPDRLRVHTAWHRLAELVNSYDDLAGEVVRGMRRLPAPAGGGR
ncbi:DUF4254 domain-containing protein [Nocardia colli]|uniref:DUF4254 domain-containing protein n=1 Tax=Nocardia colli TaxID=2545717 RepID=UPI0035DF1902